MLAPVDNTSDPTTPSEKRVRCPLRDIHEVRAQMVTVYRETRGVKLPIETASKLTFILTQIAKILETSDLQSRIEKLEQGQ
jgi:hypothetical protein